MPWSQSNSGASTEACRNQDIWRTTPATPSSSQVWLYSEQPHCCFYSPYLNKGCILCFKFNCLIVTSLWRRTLTFILPKPQSSKALFPSSVLYYCIYYHFASIGNFRHRYDSLVRITPLCFKNSAQHSEYYRDNTTPAKWKINMPFCPV